jgi:hypothetical protein
MQLDTASFRNTAAPARVRSYRDTPARWTQDVRRDPGTDARRQQSVSRLCSGESLRLYWRRHACVRGLFLQCVERAKT